MELIAQLPLIGPTLSVVLPFLLVLGIVVFVHEYGHYIVGRWCGIGADAFSVGFGPEIYGWTDRRGTRWRIAALPLGGYVKFHGDADAASTAAQPEALARMTPAQRAGAFHAASVERRALTVLAGPMANFILAIVIFALAALGQGRPVEEPVIGDLGAGVNPEFAAVIEPGDRVLRVDGQPVADFAALQAALTEIDGVREAEFEIAGADGETRTVVASFRAPARVDAVSQGSAAEAAGLEAGDVVVAVDGEPVSGFSDLQRRVQASDGAALRLTVMRGDERLALLAQPRMTETTDPLTGETAMTPVLGVQKLQGEVLPLTEPVDPLSALSFGVDRTWTVIAMSLQGIGSVLTGAQEAREVLGGPIRIAEVSGDAAAEGGVAFIGLIAVLSASIGLINLFPIPILDGGHLVFYAIEKLRGRPLRPRWQEIGNSVGLALVLALMIFATFNDITRL
jgi:regulator of sigma E protease